MAFKVELLLSRFQVVLAGAGMLACAGGMAAEYPVDIKTDPEGRHFVVEKQGTGSNPVLVTKRVGPDKSTHFMKRSFDCKNWTVRYLGEGATLEAMNKSQADPDSTAIRNGSIPDQFARHACPAPHPPSQP